MVGNSSGPSKLHLKKKLIRYGKAPMLQEPQLFPSSTSFSNFKSTPSACQIHDKEAEAKSTEVNKKRRKKVYLYDHGNHSSNHEVDDSLKSVSESLGYSSSNHARRTRSEKSLDDFMSVHDGRETSQEMFQSRRLRRMCTSAVSRAQSFCDSKSEELEHQTQISRHKPRSRRHGDTIGSLRESSAFFDGFGEVGQHRQRCRSSRNKDNRRGDCSSPSLCSITRSGSKIRHHSKKSKKNSSLSQRYQIKPLLEDSSDGACSSTHQIEDDLSRSIQELELEAFSQLRPTKRSALERSSYHTAQEDRELILHGGSGREILESRSLCEKYRPRSFDEILGQPFVIESLKNAISKGSSPAYVFQGPSGTGKTSVAMVFAAALNCQSIKDKQPCGLCNPCTDTLCNRNGPIIELGTNTRKGMNRLRYILKHAPAATSIRQFVVVVDGCHILSSEVWSELCRVVEDPPPHVAFIFTVTHQANLPHSITSRCNKYRFLKISEADIVSRLRILCAKENIDIEDEALEVIARCSCGSLLEAEMMLDQSTLLGKRITPTTVKDLVGFVSDETALGLLEAALSSDTIETVRKSRELLDFGIDPVALMSQLAGFLTDIIAGTHKLATQQGTEAPYVKNILTEVKLDRLLQALQILSDAEKQLSLSSEPSTWFTAALIKLSSHNTEPNTPSSCSRISNEKLNDASNKLKHASKNITSSISKVKSGSYSTQGSHLIGSITKMKTDSSVSSMESHGTSEEDHHSNEYTNRKVLEYASSEKLEMIWRDCIEKCYIKELKQLLAFHLKLVEIKESESALIACLVATDNKAKHQAERFLSSITNLITTTLKQNVEVMIDIMPRKSSQYNEATSFINKMGRLNLNMNQLEHSQVDEERSQDLTLLIQTLGRNNWGDNKTFLHEQRLDNAWKEEAKKGETEFRTHNLWYSDSRNAGQNGVARIIAGSTNQCAFNTDTNKLNPQSSQHVYKREHNHMSKRHHPTLSPSLLHIDNLMADLANKKQGHEDAAEYDGFCCWKTSQPKNREMREERGASPNMAGILPCFGKCWARKNKDDRYRL
ncbi:hypothetical protein ZIOFF_037524 [Zingiber officinale]|uniref:AAA+ ATPase domain-containing protein n=1 Tax=Zingiber officinale TaxID=94328 RepID=A0A8J5GF32_ZINOF|nr:hypothetical protein ZIOFF_037524 [Zingiber officinale]